MFQPMQAQTCVLNLFSACSFLLTSWILSSLHFFYNEGCHEILQTPIGPVSEEERVPQSVQKLLNKAAFWTYTHG